MHVFILDDWVDLLFCVVDYTVWLELTMSTVCCVITQQTVSCLHKINIVYNSKLC